MDVAEVQAGLAAAVRPFGPVAAAPPTLRWGSLVADLDGGEYAAAVELIYEGYLYHYRESRLAAAPLDRETALLAGDCLYARGLRLVAAAGDAQAVGLLSRLMAACSFLRATAAPFAADDVLWAATMGGLAALRAGAAPSAACALFDEFDALVAAGEPFSLGELAAAWAPGLPLAAPAPLAAALAAATVGSALVTPPTE